MSGIVENAYLWWVGLDSVGDESGELRSVLDAQLLKCVHDVGLDGSSGDVQLPADLAIREALRDQFSDSTLGGRQLCDRIVGCGRSTGQEVGGRGDYR